MKLTGNQLLAAVAGLFVLSLVAFLALRENGDLVPLATPAAATSETQPSTSTRRSKPTGFVTDPFAGKPRNDGVDSGTAVARRTRAAAVAASRSARRATTDVRASTTAAAPTPPAAAAAKTPDATSASTAAPKPLPISSPLSPPVIVTSRSTQKLAASSRRVQRMCRSHRDLDTDDASALATRTRSTDRIANELELVLGRYFADKDGAWKGQSAREVMIEIAETLLYTCKLPTFSSVISRTVTDTTGPRLSLEALVALLLGL